MNIGPVFFGYPGKQKSLSLLSLSEVGAMYIKFYSRDVYSFLFNTFKKKSG